jgi:hypothetical protein
LRWKQKRQKGAKKAKEAEISGFLPLLLLFAFFASPLISIKEADVEMCPDNCC